jgi:hypothetical protein
LGQKLTEIDELTRPDHSHLLDEDECYHLGEYTARMGFAFSTTNDLVQNFKKPVARKNLPEYVHKDRALASIARAFRETINPEFLEQATLVPIPPSKCKTDAEYDDRMVRMVRAVCANTANADIRELIVQAHSLPSFHAGSTHSPQQLIDNWSIDETLATPTPRLIGLFDDVLTTGAHLRAATTILTARFPEVKIVGLFYARRVPTASEI